MQGEPVGCDERFQSFDVHFLVFLYDFKQFVLFGFENFFYLFKVKLEFADVVKHVVKEKVPVGCPLDSRRSFVEIVQYEKRCLL